ncbi:MAG: hypothetical protein JSV54_06825 [Chloroflexota bacterium]|nr:MAG: hypothetical protein JSV54_06825 [Chloroflexota bacterium]
MSKDKLNEKQFLEYLDRLLAGKQITLGDDVSDEVRSSLEHARKMLAFREEPSPDFRTELRNKLLRQLAEKQAAAYPMEKRPGLSQRLANIFPPRPTLIAVTSTVVVVLLAFVGVVLYASQRAAAPSAEYSVQMPANIVPEGTIFTAKTSLSTIPGQAPVYEIRSDEVTAASVTELGRRLGFTGKANLSDDGTRFFMSQGSGDEARQLTVWIASGAVEYRYVEPEKLYPAYPAELPSQHEAELIAYDFLQQADLLPPGYQTFAELEGDTTTIAGGGYSVSRKYTEEAAPSEPAEEAIPRPAAEPPAPSAPSEGAEPATLPAPTYWLVDFPYKVNGASATGPGSKIEVSIGDNGEVVRLLWSWRQMSPISDRNIISQKQAYDDLIQGKGSLDIPLDCEQVIVEQVQLKYWLDAPSESQDYAVPVYEFTGECLDENGRHLEDFTAWTPALSETY